jgi:hypothetical protein
LSKRTEPTCSSLEIVFDTAEVDMPSCRPAAAKEPRLTIARKHRSWESVRSDTDGVDDMATLISLMWRYRK